MEKTIKKIGREVKMTTADSKKQNIASKDHLQNDRKLSRMMKYFIDD